jgi:hypothetical protein
MGRYSIAFAVLGISLVLGGTAQAQAPWSAPDASTSLQPPPCDCPPLRPMPALPYCQPAPANDRTPPFAVQLLLGQESGIRGQVSVTPNMRDALVIEGFAGWLFHDAGDSSALGVGTRYLIRTDWLGGGNSLQFGPGADVFFQLNNNRLVLLAGSVDVSYLQKLNANLEWELGLEAGVAVGVSGHTNSGKSGVGEVIPLISVFTGLRF